MVTADHESVVLVEVLCFISLGIHYQRMGVDLFACLKATLNGTTDQKLSQTPSPVF